MDKVSEKIKSYDIPAERFFQYFNLPVKIFPQPNQRPLPPHNHEFSEIAVILNGKGLHECNGSASEITAGDVLFIPQGIIHSYEKTEDLGLTNILYLPSRLSISGLDIALSEFFAIIINTRIPHETNPAAPLIHLSVEELAETQRLCGLLEKEHEERAYGHEFACRALFMELLLLFTRNYESCNNRKQTLMQSRIGNVIAYLNRHYAEEITLDFIAVRAGMSPRNMIRLFKIATGTTPMNYLLSLRIYQASEMLRDPDLSISEIAGKCGFSDSNYFTRQYHHLTGKSPSGFRKAVMAAGE